MTISTTLFPPANRKAAAVAFARTAWQVLRSVGLLAGTGGIFVTASQIAQFNWVTVGFAIAAVLLSAVLSGLLAAGDVLAHGLPDAYTKGTVSVPIDVPTVVAPPQTGVITLADVVSPADVPVLVEAATITPASTDPATPRF